MLKLGPKEYSSDKELKDIVHALHVYDEMLDDDENFVHIKSMLLDLGVEMDPTPDDVAKSTKSSTESSTEGSTKEDR